MTKESWDSALNVAIVCLYGYPQKHDSEPFAGQVIKTALDIRFSGLVSSAIYLLGHAGGEEGEAEKLAQELADPDKTQIIGVSIPQGTRAIAEEFLLNLIELGYPGVVVLGHALPTYFPEEFIDLIPTALIIRSWGEKTFGDIVERVLDNSTDFSDIPNLTFVDNGEIISTDIDWPDEFNVPVNRDPQNFFPRVEASRGCHHDKCTFCTRPLRNKNQSSWMRVPPEIVLRDIENIREQGGNVFTFTDEDFFGNDLIGAMKIAEGIKKIGGLKFALDLRSDSIINPFDSPEEARQRDLLIRTLIDAGMSLVYVGAETFSRTQLRRYGKGVTPEDQVVAIRKMLDLSVPLELGLITFDPVMTLNELVENVAMLESTGLWRFCGQLFNELRVFEGNPYCNILKRNNLDTGFDPNYMTYSYRYLHSEIEQIRNVCISLKKEVDPVYTSARNIFRTNFAVPDCVDEYITNYRARELEILKQLIQSPIASHTAIASEAQNAEYQCVQKLRSDLMERGLSIKPEYAELVANIEEYMRHFEES